MVSSKDGASSAPVVLVTGGVRGIGLETADLLASRVFAATAR